MELRPFKEFEPQASKAAWRDEGRKGSGSRPSQAVSRGKSCRPTWQELGPLGCGINFCPSLSFFLHEMEMRMVSTS